MQPPILGDCRFDKMFALSGGGNDYPILCGWNGGHHVYLDVADKSTTDLTFVIKQLKEELYTCLDRFDVVKNLNRNSVSSNVTFFTFSLKIPDFIERRELSFSICISIVR